MCAFRFLNLSTSKPCNLQTVRGYRHREAPQNPSPATRSPRLRFYKQSLSITLLESTLAKLFIPKHLKSFRINTYEKTRGRVLHSFPHPQSPFTPKETRHPESAAARG